MLTLEWYSYLLEFPNNAYTLLNQTLIVFDRQEYCKLIGWYLEKDETTTSQINTPYYVVFELTDWYAFVLAFI